MLSYRQLPRLNASPSDALKRIRQRARKPAPRKQRRASRRTATPEKRMKFLRLAKTLLTLFVAAELFAGAALAQATYTTGFESPAFTSGDVNGQQGWGHISNSPTKGVIESTPGGSPAAFGAQLLALRTR